MLTISLTKLVITEWFILTTCHKNKKEKWCMIIVFAVKCFVFLFMWQSNKRWQERELTMLHINVLYNKWEAIQRSVASFQFNLQVAPNYTTVYSTSAHCGYCMYTLTLYTELFWYVETLYFRQHGQPPAICYLYSSGLLFQCSVWLNINSSIFHLL